MDFQCGQCGWLTVTPTGTDIAVVFHPCPSSGRRERSTPTFIRDREEETAQWAQDRFGPIGDALADSIPEDDLLRRMEEE